MRNTGDQKYRDWAWEAFLAINETARGTVGFSDISDVDVPNGGHFDNKQESFVFAEVLKYSYLIQKEVSCPFPGELTFLRSCGGRRRGRGSDGCLVGGDEYADFGCA